MKKLNQAPEKEAKSQQKTTQPKPAARAVNQCASALAALPNQQQSRARSFIDNLAQSIRECPKTQRVRRVLLTRAQQAEFHAPNRRSFLKDFVQSAADVQLFTLLGTTPVAWEVGENVNRGPVVLIAIYHPTANELRAYSVTEAKACARRALIKAEADNRLQLVFHDPKQ